MSICSALAARARYLRSLPRPAFFLAPALGALLFVGGPPTGVTAADGPPTPPPPVRVIFDTDMGNDVDDALALAMLHALQKRRDCELLAVTLTKNHPLAGRFVDAVNTFYGRGDLPIGVRRQGKLEDSKFLPLATVNDQGQLRYPHDLDPATAPDAVPLLRQLLAREPDHSVVLVQVGFFSNLAELLDTPADAHSALTGRQLIEQKVKLLSIMAGAFQTIHADNRYREYNVVQDIPAAQQLARHWPTPIVWSGFEIGIALPYPAASIQRDYGYVPHHPIAEAYYRYEAPPHERPTWDLTAVLYAVRPEAGYFDLSPPGRVTVEADGFTRFVPQAQGRDRFLVLSDRQAPRVREALVQLSSQP
ncbi:MAG: nucleoside hydrolase [Pirellulales bacterium]